MGRLAVGETGWHVMDPGMHDNVSPTHSRYGP